MQKLNGGYVMIDLNDTNNIYARAKAAIGCGKPIMIFDDPECYYADSIKLVSDDVVITKGGKTITINDANAVSAEGSVTNPTMENIKDLSGNLRFVEGELDLTTTISNVEKIYGKWSLCGTHLLVVFAVRFTDDVSLTGFDTLARFNLPQYILDKIYNISSAFVDLKTISIFKDYTAVSKRYALVKTTLDNYNMSITMPAYDTIAVTNGSIARIQFDLLIDAE